MSLKKYNDFINESKGDNITELFLEGNITIDEWETNFNKINEGKIGDLLNNKVFPVLKSLKDKMKTAGQKGITLLSKIFKFIKTFASKNPTLSKVLTIIIIMLAVGIVTASAATGTDPNTLIPNTEVLNAAIGFVEDLYKDGQLTDILEKMQVQAYLVDLRNDGIMNEEWSEHVQKIGDTASGMMNNYSEENPNMFRKLVNFGSEVKNYIYTEIKSGGYNSTSLTLTSK